MQEVICVQEIETVRHVASYFVMNYCQQKRMSVLNLFKVGL